MIRLIKQDGQVRLQDKKLTQTKLQRFLGQTAYTSEELKSGDLMLYGEYVIDGYQVNDIASTIANREVHGPVIICTTEDLA